MPLSSGGSVREDGPVEPEGWATPRGYSNGYRLGEMLFVAGQVSWDENQQLVGPGDFAVQFRQALKNVRAVLDTAGVAPDRVGRVTVYVTDKRAYNDHLKAVGAAWREFMGRHYPAMTLVQVADLLEDGAMVEIEATAVLR
ncbi:MAG: RidA family protein [Deltaproteobacteria bacterium]|nr:RidA family protein [Deltaproteobacteria bacterium]